MLQYSITTKKTQPSMFMSWESQQNGECCSFWKSNHLYLELFSIFVAEDEGVMVFFLPSKPFWHISCVLGQCFWLWVSLLLNSGKSYELFRLLAAFPHKLYYPSLMLYNTCGANKNLAVQNLGNHQILIIWSNGWKQWAPNKKGGGIRIFFK